MIGITSFWCVVDFPHEATFLGDDDRRRVIQRLKEDNQASASHEDFKISYIKDSLTDWKTYGGCLIYMGVNGRAHNIAQFSRLTLPQVLCTHLVCSCQLSSRSLGTPAQKHSSSLFRVS